jgi:hypothetical protein
MPKRLPKAVTAALSTVGRTIPSRRSSSKHEGGRGFFDYCGKKGADEDDAEKSSEFRHRPIPDKCDQTSSR